MSYSLSRHRPATPAAGNAPEPRPEQGSMAPMSDQHTGSPKLAGWQIGLLALAGAGLATYCTVASYKTITTLAAHLGMALPYLVPAGIEGGLYFLMTLDLVLTWIDRSVWWLKYAVALFGLGVIAANASAGWPDYRSAALRAAAPTLLVIGVHVARHALDHEAARRRAAKRAARAQRRADRIPPVRWVIAPSDTYAMWRRMHLWAVPSYAAAVDLQIDQLAATARLTKRFGPDWIEHLPADLAWQLQAGVRMPDALARVDQILNPPVVPDRSQDRPQDRSRTGRQDRPRTAPKARTAPAAGQRPAARTAPVQPTAAAALTAEQIVLDLLEDARCKGDPTGETVTTATVVKATGCTDRYSRKLLSKLRPADAPTNPLDRPAGPVQPKAQDRSPDRS